MPVHKTRPQDCIQSLSDQYGIPSETIWNHADNGSLRGQRPDPHLLAEGDVVFIPDRELRLEEVPTGERHVFRRRLGVTKFELRLLEEGEPLRQQPYLLSIEGEVFEGETDENGLLAHDISSQARDGVLYVEGADPIELHLGKLDPIESVTGLQQRLANLNYDCGPIDGVYGERSKAAVRAWQRDHGLTVDGIVGPQTRSSLGGEHGC